MTQKLSGNAFNFTKADIEAIKPSPDGARLVFRDTKTTGLELRVTANGVKTFSLRRRVRGGGVERHTIGRFPDLSVTEARDKANEFIPQLAIGKSISEQKREQKAEQTFGQLFNDYIQRHAKPSKRTWQEDETKYQMHLARALGSKKLSKITRRDVAAVHSKLTLGGQPTTANRVLALVSSVYGWAKSAGLWENNPAEGIRRNTEQPRDRFLQSDELPRFFGALAAEPNETIRDYLLVSLLTGARRANVLSMRWKDVSMERAEWRIQRTKNDDPQTVNLSTEAMELLGARKEASESPFVFPGDGKTGHLIEPIKGWQRVLKRAASLGFVQAVAAAQHWSAGEREQAEALALSDPDMAIDQYKTAAAKRGIQPDQFVLADLRIHDLRRTLGSWQAKMGASLAIIGKSLNHRNVATTAIYARLDQDPVRQSVQGAASAILQAGGWTPDATVLPLRKKA